MENTEDYMSQNAVTHAVARILLPWSERIPRMGSTKCLQNYVEKPIQKRPLKNTGV